MIAAASQQGRQGCTKEPNINKLFSLSYLNVNITKYEKIFHKGVCQINNNEAA